MKTKIQNSPFAMVSFVIHFSKIYTLKKSCRHTHKHFRQDSPKTINIWGKEWGFRLAWEREGTHLFPTLYPFTTIYNLFYHMHILFSFKA